MPIPQISVDPVAGARDLHRFVVFPWAIYRDDPNWVPPLIGTTKQMLTPGKHPFHEHADVALFLARREGEIVGRIAAIVNHRHNEFHDEKTGFFGFFESVDDPLVAGALLDRASAWTAERGMDRIRGPASFSTNEECALLVDGFDTPPMILMPHNPPYYATLLERNGLAKAKDLLAYFWRQEDYPEAMKRLAQSIARKQRATLRPLDMKQFQQEIARFTRVYNRAWERNWGFVPMTDAEIVHMAKELKPAVDPDLILFVEKGDETVGFAMGLPDMNRAVRHANGRLLPFGLLKILWHARRISAARVPVLGILEEHRGQGLDVLLYDRLIENGARHGIREGEFSWILEDKRAMRRPLERLGSRVYKTYRFYEKPLG
ncbi:MAG: N-acetyltransferase [Candidatus Eisenbacteria bacterium]|nr:N-acetyltransferase [Candidatus Latescibacterota bacterium]MBD3301314.1 N-acetyltransferase [Candidatus Eisenbacteria bacterium]